MTGITKTLALFIVTGLTTRAVVPQKTKAPPAHTHDILAVKFSPDDAQLLSYSAGDGWLILWDVRTGYLIWKSKTELIQRANEYYTLEQFYWSEDGKLIVSKSANETYQTWDAKTGELVGVFDQPPKVKLKSETKPALSVTKGYDCFYLSDSTSKTSFKIDSFSRTGTTYDISHDNNLFAEGGSWGNAAIKITEFRSGRSWLLDGHLTRRPLTISKPSELELRLTQEKQQRLTLLRQKKAERDKQAAIDVQNFRKLVYITFEHYGDMDDPGQRRLLESNKLNKSVVQKSIRDATAIWLRLHNDSPLPITVPTQNMSLPDPKCFFEFSKGQRILGLCDNREIYVWHGLEEKNGKPVPYGFDFGSSEVLLPKTSAVFPVPRALLHNGRAIYFQITFQKTGLEQEIEDYGKAVVLRFSQSDLPKED